MRTVSLALLAVLTACGARPTCPDMPMVCIVTLPSGGCTYSNAVCCGTEFVCTQGQLSTAPGTCPLDPQTQNLCR
jgi:hypothetical protein